MRYLFIFEKITLEKSEEERLKIREKYERPLIKEITEKCKERLIHGKILPKSKLRIALGYLCSLIPYLENYHKDPNARLDNNTAERAIRPLAIGRKHWLFVGSQEGGKAAAIILSLVQSCRASNVNPREYLEDVMKRLMSHKAQKLDELLPLAWTNERNTENDQDG